MAAAEPMRHRSFFAAALLLLIVSACDTSQAGLEECYRDASENPSTGEANYLYFGAAAAPNIDLGLGNEEVDQAFEDAIGITFTQLETMWRASLNETEAELGPLTEAGATAWAEWANEKLWDRWTNRYPESVTKFCSLASD